MGGRGFYVYNPSVEIVFTLLELTAGKVVNEYQRQILGRSFFFRGVCYGYLHLLAASFACCLSQTPLLLSITLRVSRASRYNAVTLPTQPAIFIAPDIAV